MTSPPDNPRNPDRPQTAEDVLDALSDGRLTPAEAFASFRTLEAKPVSVSVKSGRGGPGKTADEATANAAAEAERRRRLQDALDELDALVGLASVKELVREIQAFVTIQRRRAEALLAADSTALHMIFKGNPGTGKTTVARVLGRMFKEMDALPKGHLVECERADLVGEYIGHTAQRTREHIRKALGGVLFIDEAYALARGGEKDFGKEAIDTLVKSMEDHKDEFIVILAGYRVEMDGFLASNPGLQSRFPIQIDFPDYSPLELLRIAEHMCADRQYRLSSAAGARLLQLLHDATGHPYAGNARHVRNVIEGAIRRQAVRLVRRRRLTRDDLMTLEAADLLFSHGTTSPPAPRRRPGSFMENHSGGGVGRDNTLRTGLFAG